MSRIAYSNLYDNTKLKLSQKTYALENTFNIYKPMQYTCIYENENKVPISELLQKQAL